MRRGLAGSALLLLVVVLQVTVVDRLPLPGRSGPDVVLILVIALGLAQGETVGMAAGFVAGLGLDLAPPSVGPVGASALVLCLVGYSCGRIGRWLERSVPRLVAVAVAAAACGEALRAAAGRILGDPGITLAAARHLLPATAAYDALLSPVVVILAVAAAGQSAGQGQRERPAAGSVGSGSVPAVGTRPAPQVRLRLREAGRGSRPAMTRHRARQPRLRPDRRWQSGARARPARPVRLPARTLRSTGRSR